MAAAQARMESRGERRGIQAAGRSGAVGKVVWPAGSYNMIDSRKFRNNPRLSILRDNFATD
jgi:hypothetical protein